MLKHIFEWQVCYLRATLYPDGPDSVETLLTQVMALSEHIHPAALEVLEFIEVYLKWKTSRKHLFISRQIFSIIFL